VSSASTSSGRPVTVVCVVQVLITTPFLLGLTPQTLTAHRAPVVGTPGDFMWLFGAIWTSYFWVIAVVREND
jgi:hypothetical protein